MTVHANDAHPYPIYNARFRLIVPLLDADGDPISPSSPDTELSQDLGTFADATNEATEIATSSGVVYVDLIATEMDTTSTAVRVQSTGAKTTIAVLNPKRLPVIRTGTAQAGAATTITLDSNASAIDDYYVGCYVNITNNDPANVLGQARVITDYVGSTKVATVPTWGTNPSSASTFEILATAEWIQRLADINSLLGTAIATPTTGGVLEVDLTHIAGSAVSTTTAQLGVNLVQISGDATAADNLESYTDGTTPIPANVTQLGGAAQSLTDLKDFADDGYDPATNKVQGVVLVDTLTTYTGNTVQTGDSFARLGAPAGASISADIAAIEAQTDDIGAAGAGLTAIPWNAAWDAEVQSEVDDALVARNLDKLIIASGTADSGSTTTMVDAARTEADNDYWKGRIILFTSGNISGQCVIITDFVAATDTFTFAPPTTQAVSTQDYVILPGLSVWDDTLAEHLISGSTGSALNAAGAAGDPWSTALPGAYGAGTAGKIVGDNINATISSRASQASVDTIDDFVDDLESRLTSTRAGYLDNLSAGAVALQTSVDDLEGRLGTPSNLGSGASIAANLVDIEGQTDDIGVAGAGLTAVPWNPAWDTEVQSEAEDALVTHRLDELLNADSDIDGAAPPTVGSVFHELMSKTTGSFTYDQTTDSNEAIRDRGDSAWTTATLTAQNVWEYATRILTAGTNIVLAKGVGVTGFNDLSAAQVNAEVVDTLATDTYAEPGQGNPAATTTLAAKLNYIYKWMRNKKDNNGTTTNFYADDGTTVDQKQTTSESGGTVTKAEIVTGP